ncbi:hypothetical protein BJ875DRAFT_478401 [Amylocarpus encephaloides]|uniref:Secreted protein n=1 Tax=Amylocarpus encephaloides TaxID=45428 RepID=A0A9P7Y7S0_9HELO|nr:hypothetical protein BJ875DRAFT_478401 [Amylocarpus encephaloides]
MATVIVVTIELHFVSSSALATCPLPGHPCHSTGWSSTKSGAARSVCLGRCAGSFLPIGVSGGIGTKPPMSRLDVTANAILPSSDAHF